MNVLNIIDYVPFVTRDNDLSLIFDNNKNINFTEKNLVCVLLR